MTPGAPYSSMLGLQRPRISCVPTASSSAGVDAIELAELAGLDLDPWQQFVLAGALGELHGRHAAFEVAVIVPRQNGKGSILEARELAGLFILGERLILHSAHEFKTAAEGFRRILVLIENTPDFDSQVAKVTRSHGDEGIELKSGQRLRFVARSGGSGRGFTGDCVIMDEAYALDGRAMGALLPTLSARPNPQLWYTSSAGQAQSETLRSVRARGLAGNSPRLAYFEHSADDAEAVTDADTLENIDVARLLRAVAQANPALGIRITSEFVLDEFDALDADEFNRERLGIWDDFGAGGVFSAGVWPALEDDESAIAGALTLAIEVAEDRTWSAIAAAGNSARDGLLHVEVAEYRPGTAWVVARAIELVEKHAAAAVVVQPSSQAGGFITALENAGLRVIEASPRDYAQGCGMVYDDVVGGDLRHLGQGELDESVRGVRKKTFGEAWIWNRRTPGLDISPLSAVTLAVWGFREHGAGDITDSIW